MPPLLMLTRRWTWLDTTQSALCPWSQIVTQLPHLSQASLQAISVSGRYLKIIASSSAITPNERRKLTYFTALWL